MSARAAMLWEVQPEDVAFDDGVFVCTKDPADRIGFKDLAGRLQETGGLISCSVSDQFTGCGAQLAGNIVDVEVDPDTGKVEILRYTTFLDAGRAIHPAYVEGQMQGGALQGIGWALNEEYYFTEDGAMANPTLLDYRMPTTLDLPMIDTVIVEVPNPNHPFGLRGVGEAPIVPPIPAIANAIYHAVGVRMDRLPMSPGAVLKALEARDDSH
jgi:CO/xanthine dehydrogenase Mo-binding subunit